MNDQIQHWDLSRLKPNERNSRTHSKRQLQQLRHCIEQFGFINPVLAESDGKIVAGHGRVMAAKSLGLKQLPVLVIDHLTPAQLRLFAIADNKVAENAGWNREILHLELKELSQCADLDLGLTGFETAEIDLLITEFGGEAADIEDLATPNGASVSQLGDIWQIGPHRLVCGDARDPQVYTNLMNGAFAQQVFSDPPYNVPIGGHVSGLGKHKHREFAMGSGEMSPAEFIEFLTQSFQLFAKHSKDGSLHYICMDWRHIGEIAEAGKKAFADLKNLCVWSKTNAGMGSLYRSQHELVFVFKNGNANHVNNVELGRYGRYRSNVWNYAGQNSFGTGRDADLAAHPTVKPVELVADAIADASNRGDIILDGFCGIGTTLIAAQKMGRRGFGIELAPSYVDTAIRRLEKRCHLTAVHADLGLAFEDLARLRKGECS